jgi:hypothetical protein
MNGRGYWRKFLARVLTNDYWAAFRKSAAELYDGFVSLIEPIEDMQPHRLAEHEQRRARFVERQCLEMTDQIVEFSGPHGA